MHASLDLAKQLPMACRATLGATVLAMRTAAAGAVVAMTPARRDELLAKCKAGAYVELELDLLAYEQKPGVTNRNFVRFRDGGLVAMGRTGKNTPLLRDHAQGDTLAKAGIVLDSTTEKRADGDYVIRQTVRITATWAVELALRNLLSTVSIGWNPTGPVNCSACKATIDNCYHWPGTRLAEVDDGDRGKRMVRKADGPITVEWIFTDAELVETSLVTVPAVPGAHIEEIRAALSARQQQTQGAPMHEPSDPNLIRPLPASFGNVAMCDPAVRARVAELDRRIADRGRASTTATTREGRIIAALAVHSPATNIAAVRNAMRKMGVKDPDAALAKTLGVADEEHIDQELEQLCAAHGTTAAAAVSMARKMGVKNPAAAIAKVLR